MSNDNRRIYDRLMNSKDMEMMPNDLEQMLDEELAKPEEEIDHELVSDLINLLEDSNPTGAEKRADWNAIIRRHRKELRLPRMLRVIATAVAGFVLLFAISFSSAKAFNWTFLLKYLLPVAQTFGIISSDYVIDDGQVTEYGFSDDWDTQEITFTSLDALPTDLGTSIVESNCIPDGYLFVQGTWFKDIDLEKCSFFFAKNGNGNDSDGDKSFHIEILELSFETSPALDIEYELQFETPLNITVGDEEVTLYYNSPSQGISVSWLIDNIHFNLYGSLTEEELSYIIQTLSSYYQ